MDRIFPIYWLELSHEERMYLTAQFNVPTSGGAVTDGGVLISDGKSVKDLEVFTKESMAAFVGESADTEVGYARLWELTKAKAHADITGHTGVIGGVKSVDEAGVVAEVVPTPEVAPVVVEPVIETPEVSAPTADLPVVTPEVAPVEEVLAN